MKSNISWIFSYIGLKYRKKKWYFEILLILMNDKSNKTTLNLNKKNPKLYQTDI